MSLKRRIASSMQHILLLSPVALCTTTDSSRVVAPTLPGSAVAATPFDPVAVDRFISAQMARHRIPGLALAITQGNQVVHVRGYGTAHDGKPVTGQTPFRIASLSKAFTAMAVLRLVEGGRMSLDAPIKQYLPRFELATPSATAKITVRQLLNHTSGSADTGFANSLPGHEQTLADRIASLRTARAVDAAGAAFHYLDPNYQVLAHLVEAASGEPFDTYLQRHVFAPLAMHDSFSTLFVVVNLRGDA